MICVGFFPLGWILDGLEKKTYGLSYLMYTLAKHLKQILLQDILFIFVVGCLSGKKYVEVN